MDGRAIGHGGHPARFDRLTSLLPTGAVAIVNGLDGVELRARIRGSQSLETLAESYREKEDNNFETLHIEGGEASTLETCTLESGRGRGNWKTNKRSALAREE